MLHRCYECLNHAEYIKDEEAELMGFYAFKCKSCGNEFLVSKESPLIKGEK